jgi:hypothetical protein
MDALCPFVDKSGCFQDNTLSQEAVVHSIDTGTSIDSIITQAAVDKIISLKSDNDIITKCAYKGVIESGSIDGSHDFLLLNSKCLSTAANSSIPRTGKELQIEFQKQKDRSSFKISFHLSFMATKLNFQGELNMLLFSQLACQKIILLMKKAVNCFSCQHGIVQKQ